MRARVYGYELTVGDVVNGAKVTRCEVVSDTTVTCRSLSTDDGRTFYVFNSSVYVREGGSYTLETL